MGPSGNGADRRNAHLILVAASGHRDLLRASRCCFTWPTASMPEPPPFHRTRVVAEDGSTLFTGDDIMAGQHIFQKYGLMQYGTIFGHGIFHRIGGCLIPRAKQGLQPVFKLPGKLQTGRVHGAQVSIEDDPLRQQKHGSPCWIVPHQEPRMSWVY